MSQMLYKLKINGTPEYKGIVHGESCKKQIHELAELREGYLRKYLSKWNSAEIKALCAQQVANLKRISPDLYQEFVGIAMGANISETKLAILNNYTDMRDFQSDEGCSLLSYRKGDQYIVGQTWDMHGSAYDYMLYLHDWEKKTHILTVTGCLALSGINNHGLCVMINNMHCREVNPQGLMWGALVKSLLANKTVNGARKTFQSHLPSSGHNYLICDLDRALDIESTGLQTDEIHDSSEEHVFFHTNHYMGRLREYEILERQSKSTVPRFDQIKKYFKERSEKVLSFDEIGSDVLAGQACHSVYIPIESGEKSASCGGVLYDMHKKRGQIYAGLFANTSELVEINWGEES